MAAAGSKSGAWGYVEGYYGRLLSWEERSKMVSHLGSLGADTYLYAPKEDTLHRRDWRVPYDAAWRKRFAALVSQGRRAGVRVIPGLAPGLSFKYLSAADYAILLRKLKAFAALGCRTLALLMDDITPELPSDCRGAFRTLGQAHGQLLECLRDDLGPAITLWFCPTVYTDQFAAGPVARDPYLRDLAATMPAGIPLMWTGPRIISPRLTGRETGAVARMFRNDVILWDNLYANDYCPGKLFAGPFVGRGPEAWRVTRGLMLNPTGLPATDRFLLNLVAACRRGDAPKEAWRRELRRMEVPEAFDVVARFFDSPFYKVAPADLTPRRVAAYRKALKTLIWDWKGTLHREWYPYLFMLDADLKVSSRGREAPDAAWVRKRYSPLVARLLLRR